MPKTRDRENLETGYTTGTCATAVTKAGLEMMSRSHRPDEVGIELPNGETAQLDVTYENRKSGEYCFSTVKDAGDDPDVTDGATIFGSVIPCDDPGIRFEAGPGVGTVTMPGMPVEQGEAAINPVPRSMMKQAAESYLESIADTSGLIIRIGVENGRSLAENTLNPRLGIEGGLSILGTTGIVEPYSNASYVASIEQGIDVARTNGMRELVLATGGRTEKYAMQEQEELPDYAFVQFAGFLQETLEHIKRNPVERLHIYMMPGKFSKLMQGHLKLHSSESTVDMEQIRSDIRRNLSPSNGTMQRISELKSVNQTLSELSSEQVSGLMDKWARDGLSNLAEFLRDVSTLECIHLVILSLDGEVLARKKWSR